MNKKSVYLFSFVAGVAILAGGYLFMKNKRPPVETKFIQNANLDTGRDSTPSAEKSGTKPVVIKKPGNSAQVTLPFHTYQTFNNCGPATLSMILSFYGKTVGQKELADKMRPYQIKNGDNDDKTIFTSEFEDWAKKYGFLAINLVNGNIDLLKSLTANGIPVVVKTWLHVGEDIGHFRIVKGFDEAKKVIIQSDSYEGPNRRIPYYDFLSMWQPFNYAFIIVYTPEKADLIDAILGERLDEEGSWTNTLNRAKDESKLDPANIYPKFNMATSYYHLGDYEETIKTFEEIESKLPKRMLWYQIEPIQAYFELGNYDRVFEISDKILSNGNRAFSELYILRGDVYRKQGKLTEAKSEYEKALFYNKNLDKAKEALNLL